jgi:hypothetical protein
VVHAKVGGGLLKFVGLGLKFKITPPSFRDATPRVLGLTKRIVKWNAPAHFGHRLQSIHRRRRLPLWRKFNYVFTLNLRRYYYRMVCIAIDVWVIYIYITCVRASNPVWSCCGLMYYAHTPVNPLASRFHVHLRNVVYFYPHTSTRPPLSRCNPHPEDLALRRPPGWAGLIATARNTIYTSKSFFVYWKTLF